MRAKYERIVLHVDRRAEFRPFTGHDGRPVDPWFRPHLAGLTPTQEAVLRLRHGIGTAAERSVEEVAFVLGMPTAEVRRLERQHVVRHARHVGRHVAMGQDLEIIALQRCSDEERSQHRRVVPVDEKRSISQELSRAVGDGDLPPIGQPRQAGRRCLGQVCAGKRVVELAKTAEAR